MTFDGLSKDNFTQDSEVWVTLWINKCLLRCMSEKGEVSCLFNLFAWKKKDFDSKKSTGLNLQQGDLTQF